MKTGSSSPIFGMSIFPYFPNIAIVHLLSIEYPFNCIRVFEFDGHRVFYNFSLHKLASFYVYEAAA